MKIRWGWNDGYVGNNALVMEIDDSEFEGMSESQIQDCIDEIVGDAFHDRVTYYWKKEE